VVEFVDDYTNDSGNHGTTVQKPDGSIHIKIDGALEGLALRSTIFHEFIHAVLSIGGVSYLLTDTTEESIARALENLLYPILPHIESLATEKEMKDEDN
jgi:hypothetical protein